MPTEVGIEPHAGALGRGARALGFGVTDVATGVADVEAIAVGVAAG